MADYWIKLYHEILDDPKMATMPDRLWRRTIEIFLLAGKLSKDKSGIIPNTTQLAWLLRMDTNELQGDLEQLAGVGLLESVTNGWKVTNFEKRQSATTGAERVKQLRERKQKREYYDDVTEMKRNVTQINRVQNTESETDADTQPSGAFSSLRDTYQSQVRILAGKPAEIDSLQFMAEKGITPDDLKEAVHFFKQKNIPIREPEQLEKSALFAMSQRTAAKPKAPTPAEQYDAMDDYYRKTAARRGITIEELMAEVEK